jgi:hypothetical protein
VIPLVCASASARPTDCPHSQFVSVIMVGLIVLNYAMQNSLGFGQTILSINGGLE